MENTISNLREKLLNDKAFSKHYYDRLDDVEHRIGRMVFEGRINKGLSQARLARAVGTGQPAIARLEKGNSNVRIRTLIKIAKAFNAKLWSPRFDFMKSVEDEYDSYLVNRDKAFRKARSIGSIGTASVSSSMGDFTGIVIQTEKNQEDNFVEAFATVV